MMGVAFQKFCLDSKTIRGMGKEIKWWYEKNFPNDVIGEKIKDGLCFADLWVWLMDGNDMDEFIGTDDCLVLNRISKELACVFNVSVDDISALYTANRHP